MTTHRALRYAVTIPALSLILFILILLSSAKPLYVLYADLFQSGQLYQGETRALMYNRFLFTVIAPGSLIVSSVLVWIFRIKKTKEQNS